MATDPVLKIENLVTQLRSPTGTVTVVDGVSFSIGYGEIFGLVGESGCGKSVTCRSIMQLFAGVSFKIAGGSIELAGTDLTQLDDNALNRVRGRDVSMVFQDSMSGLNPTMRIGAQIREALNVHNRLTRAEAHAAAVRQLNLVHVPAPELRLRSYQHELSGGLRQRVLIAMALSSTPKLLIADEPTTALDVTIQHQILSLILERRKELGMSVLFVTHDLSVVAQICDRVAVMYAGRIVEIGSTRDVFHNPAHPYTRALLASLPALNSHGGKLNPIEGSPPELSAPPPGCRFAPRCQFSDEGCARAAHSLQQRDGAADHRDACVRGRT